MDVNQFLEKYQKVPVEHYPNKVHNKPMLSVCVQTYQHAPFIKQCLDSILMQQTNFDLEILLGEDASTDGTREICIEYAQKYPDKIRLFLHQRENNIKINGSPTGRFNFLHNLLLAQGKYIALCEGDDYWTDPLKLQKQVDFLEEHEEYVLTVGGFKRIEPNTGTSEVIIKEISGVKKRSNGYTFELDDTRKGWITKTFTSLFRNDMNVLKKFMDYEKGRDINFFYHTLKTGKGFYFTEVFGVYNVHDGGLHSSNIGINNKIAAYEVYKELHLKNKDEFTRRMRFRHALGLFNFLIKKHNKKSAYNPLKLYVEALLLFRKFKEVKLLIAAIVK